MLNTSYVGILGLDSSYEDKQALKLIEALTLKLLELGFSIRTSGTLGIEAHALNVIKDKIFIKGEVSLDRIKVAEPYNGYSKIIPNRSCYVTVNVNNYKLCSNYLNLVVPHWDSLSREVKLFNAKNAFVVFGEKLNSPLDLLVVYDDNSPTSLIKSAVDLAKLKNIPVINLYSSDFDVQINNLRSFFKDMKSPVKVDSYTSQINAL